MRIALMGTGSLGTIIGALITKGGRDIVLVDANKAHVEALNEKGATITGKMELNVPVKTITPDQMEGLYDVVIYLVKAPNNGVALPELLPHLHEKSVVCTLQNGIPEDAVASFVGKERTIGGTVGWGASLVGPGVSSLTSKPEMMTFDVGEHDGSVTDRVKEVKAVLDLVGHCDITSNLKGLRWSKLLINATFSGMSAALGCNYGEVLDNEKALLCASFIADELIKVAHAEGVSLEHFQGHDLGVFELENGIVDFPGKVPFYQKVFTPHRLVIASMLFDLRLGIKTEIEALNGEVSTRGRWVGVPSPFNDKVVELVKEAEIQQSVTTFDNLDRFDEIIALAK